MCRLLQPFPYRSISVAQDYKTFYKNHLLGQGYRVQRSPLSIAYPNLKLEGAGRTSVNQRHVGQTIAMVEWVNMHWLAPVSMLGACIGGVLFAVGPHAFYHSLDTTAAPANKDTTLGPLNV